MQGDERPPGSVCNSLSVRTAASAVATAPRRLADRRRGASHVGECGPTAQSVTLRIPATVLDVLWFLVMLAITTLYVSHLGEHCLKDRWLSI